ncbi:MULTISPECIES: hypothetical protein [Limosilactobacillus]|uniref:hypothetical protein n=1 Tax=Limosilactobacillus TaxID=2742598 RepID=UPI0014417688|nr:hypothetical protein [Limosilactobacillus reuteri]MCC4435768.1 hypothetical protein [Limosilactobacillus reuteri]MCC4437823.1 hypothetical protein [Limosilactobacillus reuteri]MCC4441439.1 hypothetical protein [Limosilactobacillus reuteri]MCC4444677.1 hypothetical protein [Limosilactobacillus reuteri]MCC4445782.1 hypothetical protein [Limosilactobacillus reuteri]
MNNKFYFSKNYVSLDKSELTNTKGGFNRLAYNMGRATAGAIKIISIVSVFK